MPGEADFVEGIVAVFEGIGATFDFYQTPVFNFISARENLVKCVLDKIAAYNGKETHSAKVEA